MIQQVGPALSSVTIDARLMRALRYAVIMLCVLVGAAPSLWAQSAGAGKDDPFYGQKGQDGVTDISQVLDDSTQAVFQQGKDNAGPVSWRDRVPYLTNNSEFRLTSKKDVWI